MIAFEMRHNMPSCENHSIANLVNLLAFIVCIPPFVIISIVVKLYNNNLKQEKFKNSNSPFLSEFENFKLQILFFVRCL